MIVKWHSQFIFFFFSLFYLHWFAGAKGQTIPSTLLIINYNFAHYESIPLLKKIYKPYFGDNIVFYGPEQHPGVNLFQHNKGYLSYMIIADAMLNYQKYEGYFFLMDDCIINAWKFSQLDRTKIWFGQIGFMRAETGNPINVNLKEKATSWAWWYTQWGWQPMLKAFNELPQDYKSVLAQNWGDGNIVAAFSDLAYIPSVYAEDFVMLATLFGQEEVFLEMALPTILSCLTSKKEWLWLPGSGTDRNRQTESYRKNMFFNHPLKLSTKKHRKFIRNLFSKYSN